MIAYPQISPEIVSLGPYTVPGLGVIGPFVLRWYGLMYVVGYVIGFQILKYRARKGLLTIGYRSVESLITHLVIGMLIGARLTYAFVYNWEYYSQNPMDVFKVWHGGLSFHGAALGMIVACVLFARRHKMPGYMVLDALAIGTAPGLFFGRFGNFFNAELYGRATTAPWGMVFPTDPEHLVRHPSQVYEALTEGVFIGVLLWCLQNWSLRQHRYRLGLLGSVFLIAYGILRFLVEFTRQPDAQLGFVLGPFSMGQVLCFLTFVAGLLMLWHSQRSQPVFTPKAPSREYLETH